MEHTVIFALTSLSYCKTWAILCIAGSKWHPCSSVNHSLISLGQVQEKKQTHLSRCERSQQPAFFNVAPCAQKEGGAALFFWLSRLVHSARAFFIQYRIRNNSISHEKKQEENQKTYYYSSTNAISLASSIHLWQQSQGNPNHIPMSSRSILSFHFKLHLWRTVPLAQYLVQFSN